MHEQYLCLRLATENDHYKPLDALTDVQQNQRSFASVSKAVKQALKTAASNLAGRIELYRAQSKTCSINLSVEPREEAPVCQSVALVIAASKSERKSDASGGLGISKVTA